MFQEFNSGNNIQVGGVNPTYFEKWYTDKNSHLVI